MMHHITRPIAAATMNTLGTRLDVHTIEARLLRNHPIAVSQELQRFQHARDPLRAWSAQLARWIDQAFHGQLSKTRKVTSNNLGGKPSKNQEWNKTRPGTPIT